jgi:hypothetical protein
VAIASASFIAAKETLLEPGDVESVAAPDAALADVGFCLVGTLVQY